MKIVMGKKAGFCFGVKRAVDMAFEVAAETTSRVYTLGPIIHNPQVIEKLRNYNVTPINSPDEVNPALGCTVIIRTHGAPENDINSFDEMGCNVIDATCPFVKKAQSYARLLSQEGYKVVILGDAEHPEVKGILSYAGPDAIVIKGAEDYPRLKGRVGIVVQTTKQVKVLQEVLAVAVVDAKELKVYNTICSSTYERQQETVEIASDVDLMIIVGGRNSANTTRLAHCSSSMSVPTYHIETSEEIKPEWFEGKNSVGITAGASTPDWIINEVKNRIMDIGGSATDGN